VAQSSSSANRWPRYNLRLAGGQHHTDYMMPVTWICLPGPGPAPGTVSEPCHWHPTRHSPAYQAHCRPGRQTPSLNVTLLAVLSRLWTSLDEMICGAVVHVKTSVVPYLYVTRTPRPGVGTPDSGPGCFGNACSCLFVWCKARQRLQTLVF
jgi:hypothetical protein